MSDKWEDLKNLGQIAMAQANGWKIEVRAHETYEWRTWKGEIWDKTWLYRGRPNQVAPAMVIPCYFTGDGLTWSLVSLPEWVRVPELDKTIKVTVK
jgi:hypothetical protein